jgi:hypothetical protein
MHVNYLAVVVAAISSFLLGGLWYSAKLFGPSWPMVGITRFSLVYAGPFSAPGASRRRGSQARFVCKLSPVCLCAAWARKYRMDSLPSWFLWS